MNYKNNEFNNKNNTDIYYAILDFHGLYCKATTLCFVKEPKTVAKHPNINVTTYSEITTTVEACVYPMTLSYVQVNETILKLQIADCLPLKFDNKNMDLLATTTNDQTFDEKILQHKFDNVKSPKKHNNKGLPNYSLHPVKNVLCFWVIEALLSGNTVYCCKI